MIPVALQPEPANFDPLVRQKGQRYLRTNPTPTTDQFKKKSFWKDALPGLKIAYNSVCAYSAVWVPTSCSVDHFLPKAIHPHLAYEWSNFRLADAKINSNKGNSVQVLDPFHIQEGWFILDIATLFIRAEPTLSTAIFNSVDTTITVLGLNNEDCVKQRFQIFAYYRDKIIGLEFLEKCYPFMASEIVRQDIQPI